MVNRILIRIKVVQMLYAYLLTRTEFKILENPDVSSPDKKFAYSVYVDLLLILLELTSHNTAEPTKKSTLVIDRKLAASAVGASISKDSTLKDIILKGNHTLKELMPVVQHLHDRITASAIFKEFSRKRKTDLENEIELWTVLFKSTIETDPELIKKFKAMPGYTGTGLEMGVDMVVSTLRSFYETRDGYRTALKSLQASLDKAHSLYVSIFVLIVRLTEARERQLENAKSKYLATAEDKNPNTRFIDNSFAAYLAENEDLKTLIKKYGIDWTDDFGLLDSLLASITSSGIYKDYMSAPSTDWEKDCEFWRQIMKNVVFQSDDFEDALESESVYWNDDLHIIGTFALKTIRQASLSESHSVDFLPQFKDEEDSRFGAELFETAVNNRDQYVALIDKYVDTENWDSDRLVFMDTVIMICAISEIIKFPNIPLAVSLNEYIDIANLYSSAKSGQFINGILFSVVEHLKSEGIIQK